MTILQYIIAVNNAIYSLQHQNRFKRIFILTVNYYNIILLNSIVGITNALEKALAGEELSYNDGVQLMKEENLFLLGAVADQVRNHLKGNVVTFVASYYLNYTNICAASCQLCAFYRKDNEPDSYTLNIEQILSRARIAIKQFGTTELHTVGGFHPKLGLDYSENIIQQIKLEFPAV